MIAYPSTSSLWRIDRKQWPLCLRDGQLLFQRLKQRRNTLEVRMKNLRNKYWRLERGNMLLLLSCNETTSRVLTRSSKKDIERLNSTSKLSTNASAP